MTELKTLKDIEKEVYRKLDNKESFNTFQDIKKEAIKWVKEDIDNLDELNIDEQIIDLNSTKRWMKRLDITEEDLK